MILHFLDGGMLFEINKTYKDFGEYALINDNNLIDNLYKNYILFTFSTPLSFFIFSITFTA